LLVAKKKTLQANVITDKTQLFSALQNKHVHVGPEPESLKASIKLVIRPKMSVFVKFVRNQRIRGKFYILYY